jgi:hypothetical protein
LGHPLLFWAISSSSLPNSNHYVFIHWKGEEGLGPLTSLFFWQFNFISILDLSLHLFLKSNPIIPTHRHHQLGLPAGVMHSAATEGENVKLKLSQKYNVGNQQVTNCIPNEKYIYLLKII